MFLVIISVKFSVRKKLKVGVFDPGLGWIESVLNAIIKTTKAGARE